MNQYYAEASRIVDAPADKVYEVIADYHEGHPAILPSRYFTNLSVVEGGVGVGTVARVEMNIFGAKALYRLMITEAVPGRRLVEEDRDAGVITTFSLEPFGDGGQTRVTISTTAQTSPGVKGYVERLLNPFVTRRIYREELDQLAALVAR